MPRITSYNVCYTKLLRLLEDLARMPTEVEYASEFRYRNPVIDDRTLVIAISQSGETADTLAAIKEAKSRGARTIGLVNVVGSTIAREVDGGLYLRAGPEIGVITSYSIHYTKLYDTAARPERLGQAPTHAREPLVAGRSTGATRNNFV